MADKTPIEWTDATWNPITGCSVVSAGCTNCYAMRLAGTRLKNTPSRQGLTNPSKAGPVWNGEVRFNEETLTQPLRWKRPRMIFVCAHGDLFHENVPDEWIDRVFAVMALCPQHTFQVLTKRPERMREYLNKTEMFKPCIKSFGSGTFWDLHIDRNIGLLQYPLPNVWIGVSVEDQKSADERIPHLLATPAAIRFVSAEPLLGQVEFTDLSLVGFLDSLRKEPRPDPDSDLWPLMKYNALTGHSKSTDDINLPKLDWIIVGGESGQGARPMHPDWVRSIRDQCAAAGTAFFFKQWGSWMSVYDRNEDPDWRNCSSNDNILQRYINLAGGHGFHGDRVCLVENVGKKAAGRLLDGVERNAMPERLR